MRPTHSVMEIAKGYGGERFVSNETTQRPAAAFDHIFAAHVYSLSRGSRIPLVESRPARRSVRKDARGG